jgi:hypothetical protein
MRLGLAYSVNALDSYSESARFEPHPGTPGLLTVNVFTPSMKLPRLGRESFISAVIRATPYLLDATSLSSCYARRREIEPRTKDSERNVSVDAAVLRLTFISVNIKLRGRSPQGNYTERATAACRRN